MQKSLVLTFGAHFRVTEDDRIYRLRDTTIYLLDESEQTIAVCGTIQDIRSNSSYWNQTYSLYCPEHGVPAAVAVLLDDQTEGTKRMNLAEVRLFTVKQGS